MSPQPPAQTCELRNWFYTILNFACLLFVVTALAYAVVPVLEQKATDAGAAPPASLLRDALRSDGWWWLLIEAGLVAILAIASMGLDRWRQKPAGDAPIGPPPP